MSGIKIATAHSHSFQSGALSFISCASGRESLPLDEYESPQPVEFKTETKKKKFHPLRNLRRMFRRKARRSSISAESYQVVDNPEVSPAGLEQRSCSTSQLQDENLTQNFMGNSNSGGANSNRLNPGLSLSHDSIFTPEKADSGLSSSDLGNSSLSITVLTLPTKECMGKSQQSSCSETSLLSIGSSEVEELSPVRVRPKLSDLDLGVTSYKLSHSAAKHKMAVKPKRNHGAPRSRRKPVSSKSPLPTTIEVNEEKIPGQNSPGSSDSSVPDFSKDATEAESAAGRREEEGGLSHRTESFFGRFLSRRSEKKKKHLQTSNGDEETVVDEKSSSPNKKYAKSGKSPSRRQRMEPVEISAGEEVSVHVDDDRVSSGTISMSPPKKAVRPEEEEEGNLITLSRDRSPSDRFSKDLRNPNFMRELASSVVAFAKDDSGKKKTESEEVGSGEDAAVNKIKRQHSESETPGTTIITVESQTIPENSGEGVTIKVIPPDNEVNSPRDTPPSIKKVPDEGAENISVIEFKGMEEVEDSLEDISIEVKEEKSSELAKEPTASVPTISETKADADVDSAEARTRANEDKVGKKESTEIIKGGQEVLDQSCKKTETEVVRRPKPVVSQKPDLKKIGSPGLFQKAKRIDVDGKCQSSSAAGKTPVNLVERRKSELMLLTEGSGDKDQKPAKESSLREEFPGEKSTSREEAGDSSVMNIAETSPRSSETSEDVVVLRRRTNVGRSDEQPELMKVFARRSLKVRETEKIEEEIQRSRDSDKENETVDFAKDERNGGLKGEKEAREGEKTRGESLTNGTTANEPRVNVTSLKLEVTPKKNLLQKYGRSLSENNARKEEAEAKAAMVEQNKTNRERRRISGPIGYHSPGTQAGEEKEGGEEAEIGGSGFKRIQQRKAEWERRAQQSAK